MRGMLQLRDSGKTQRALLLVDATVAAIALLHPNKVSAAEPKRVLMVDSFAAAVLPLTVHPVE